LYFILFIRISITTQIEFANIKRCTGGWGEVSKKERPGRSKRGKDRRASALRERQRKEEDREKRKEKKDEEEAQGIREGNKGQAGSNGKLPVEGVPGPPKLNPPAGSPPGDPEANPEAGKAKFVKKVPGVANPVGAPKFPNPGNPPKFPKFPKFMSGVESQLS
jgi:hypothetical protein